MRNRCLLPVILLLATTSATAFGHEMSPISEKAWDRSKAAHLLRRAGFGGTPEEIDALYQRGLAGAVDQLVDFQKTRYPVGPPKLDPRITGSVDRNRFRVMSDQERRKARQERQKMERQGHLETRLWWIERMIESPRPFEEKMTLFWHGHFTSGSREVRRSLFMYEQNAFLRDHALDSFRELLLGISKDRAMLLYLDNARNNRRKPNENYARELLELFSLGVGNYSESDIKAAARAFTGWSLDEDGFVFRRRQHDPGRKTFLGRTGNLTGENIIDIILQQPACSHFLARSILEFFVAPEPDRRFVARFAATLRRHEFRLKPAMKDLFKSRGFYDADARGTLIKSPVELLVMTTRQLDLPKGNLPGLERAMAAMGQELLQPPNVKGWDGNEKWINTATLYNRYNFVASLVRGERKLPRRYAGPRTDEEGATDAERTKMGRPSMSEMAPASRRKRIRQPAYDPRSAVERYQLDSAAKIVAFYADNLLAVPLVDAKRELLVDYLLDDRSEFAVESRADAERVVMMIALLTSTPEYQMN